jgi:hypothetical protein
LGGGVTAISLGSAALRKPEFVIEKSGQLLENVYYAASGIVTSVFTNTQKVIVDTGKGIFSMGQTVFDYFLGYTRSVMQKGVPEIKPPSVPDYTWWDCVITLRRRVQDSYTCYLDWSPVKINLHILQSKGGWYTSRRCAYRQLNDN